MAKILIVEDDRHLASAIKTVLEQKLYSVETAFTGDDGAALVELYDYDLLVLDWQLPGVDGVEICQRHRSRGGHTPILMLTGKRAIDEKEHALDCGADDYLTKPFDMRELTARIKVLLRRPSLVQGETLQWGNVLMDTKTHKVTRAGEHIPLQPLEYTVLEFFMRHPGEILTSDALLRRCWQADAAPSVESIYVVIRKIRKKINKPGQHSVIQTVHSLGYRLDPVSCRAEDDSIID